MRSREKEIVKRRLASLASNHPGLRDAIDRALAAFNGVKGQPRSFDRLDALLGEQSYRLSDWHVASEEINYRRFFDVNELAALRVEDPVVFDEVHKFVLELVAARRADRAARRPRRRPLRTARLPAAPANAGRRRRERRPSGTRRLPRRRKDSRARRAAPVRLARARHDRVRVRRGREQPVRRQPPRAQMDEIYRRFLRADRRRETAFDDLSYQARKQVVHATMSGDINSLGHQLDRLSERNRHYRDFTLYSLIAAIKELIACFPGVPHLHHRRGEPERARSAVRRARRAVRQPPRTGFVTGLRLHPARPAEADAGGQLGRVRGARAVHRQVPADHQPGRGQGDRGHRLLRLQPAGLAQRSRRRSRRASGSSRRPCHACDVRAAAALAVGAVGHIDARHQARRGHAGAA